jgi:hypothetical protein
VRRHDFTKWFSETRLAHRFSRSVDPPLIADVFSVNSRFCPGCARFAGHFLIAMNYHLLIVSTMSEALPEEHHTVDGLPQFNTTSRLVLRGAVGARAIYILIASD